MLFFPNCDLFLDDQIKMEQYKLQRIASKIHKDGYFYTLNLDERPYIKSLEDGSLYVWCMNAHTLNLGVEESAIIS